VCLKTTSGVKSRETNAATEASKECARAKGSFLAAIRACGTGGRGLETVIACDETGAIPRITSAIPKSLTNAVPALSRIPFAFEVSINRAILQSPTAPPQGFGRIAPECERFRDRAR
jgi:hypothetical protein